MRDYVRTLQERCKQAAQGQLSEEEQEALAQEAMCGFGQVPVMGRSVWDAANNKNWNGLMGALGACLAIDNGDAGVSVTQNANPSISQSQTTNVNVAIQDVVRAIDTDDLSDEQRKEIKALLLDADANKDDKGKLRKIGKQIADWGFEKGVESLPKLLSFLAGLLAT